MTYSELLKHPYWQKRRLEIFKRDNFCCQKCSDWLSNLQVHHLYYLPDTLPWDYPDDSMITVCELCHKKEEFIKWVLKYGVRSLVYHGFLRQDANEIKDVVFRIVDANKHKESAIKYMDNIKLMMSHG